MAEDASAKKLTGGIENNVLAHLLRSGQVHHAFVEKGALAISVPAKRLERKISLPTFFGQFSSVAEDASAKEVPNRGIENNVLAHLRRSVQHSIFFCRGVESDASTFILPRFPLLVASARYPLDSLFCFDVSSPTKLYKCSNPIYIHLHLCVPARLQGLFHAPLGTALCIPFSAGTFTPKKNMSTVYRFLSASSSQANRRRKLQREMNHINQRKSLPFDCAQRSRPTKAMPTLIFLRQRVFCRSMVATRLGGNVTCFDVTRLGARRGQGCEVR